ncbi:MAG TPA: hypothetical protein VKO87_12025, partial [Gemmatimonadaceae bacterium]|nr:hypothetical protein [Gemmatimonadaceae bacterium]
MRIARAIAISATALISSSPVFAQNAGASYHVAKRIAAGGEGGWDYLVADALNRRLYVTRGSHVMVFDMDRDSLIGDIPGTPGVHGVALARNLNRGFTSNGRDSSLTV